jgi:hypothetical protein
MWARRRRRRLGGPGDGAGDRGSISGKGRQLLKAGFQNFGDAPRFGAAGADLEDESNARPQSVDEGAAELGWEPEGRFDGGPRSLQLRKQGVAGDEVEGC